MSKSKVLKTGGPGALFEVRMPFCVAGAMDPARRQKWVKHVGFVAISKTMASVGHLKGVCKYAFARRAQYKRHVHQSC